MSEQHAIDLDVTHARQARRGRHALVILMVSLSLVIIALFGTWAYYSGDLARGKGDNAPPQASAPAPQTSGPIRQSDEG